MTQRAVYLSIIVVVASAWNVRASDPAGIDFFEKKIRPVLVEHCYSCHTSVDGKKPKGDLTLDTRAAILKGGETGPALVPGKPAESLLIKAVRYADPDFRMPPKGKLPAEAIADLEKWIAMGAPDPRTGNVAKTKYGPSVEEGRKFWAFQPPKKYPLPAVKNAGWSPATIDRFLLASLESKGLEPAKDADRVALIRRASYALIGLPPTAKEVDAFVRDQAPGAFARVVDQLLASPHFGERWGRHWLDVARYAESTGGGRSLLLKDAWRYRDYVIDAFNRDKPYNRFITEQIAGDLLKFDTPGIRRDYLIATALLLLGPTNYERQDKPVLEMDIIDEQLDTIGKSMLGMTIGCARCHDHKFDPIPTKDYYALAGIFKSTKWIVHDNVSRWTEQPLPMTPDLAKRVKEHDAAVAVLKSKIQTAKAAEKKAGKGADTTIVAGVLDPRELPGIIIDDAQAKKVGNWKHSKFTGNYVGEGYQYDDRAMKGEKTLTFVPDFPKTGFYEVRLAYVAHVNRATNVPVRVFHADGDETIYVDQRKTPALDGRFVSLGRFRFEQGNQWFVMVSTEKANGHVVADAVQFLPDEVEEKKPAPKVAAQAVKPAVESKTLEAELKRLLASGPDRPTAMAVSDAAKSEDIHIAIRGNYHNRGEKAPRGFLQVAMPAGATGPGTRFQIPANESGRLQLAEWLASPDNPLTARVMANRIWHHLFGTGLVRTVDNFGSTGETPSHPELLDHLALRFIEQGWSVKKLIREIMLTRAYQMSSEADAEVAKVAQKVDPENRLLWKANQRRLDAEAIRDTILMVSGNLDRAVGGPTIKKGTTLERDYQFIDTRRSIYTPVFRNKLHELFEVFDFPDPNITMGRRNVSTVAPQALYLMNSAFVMQQARLASDKLLATANLDDAARIDRAYHDALGRAPSERERRLALRFLNQESGQRAEAWAQLYQTLFACIDFRYVN
jgi:hypothetical protein